MDRKDVIAIIAALLLAPLAVIAAIALLAVSLPAWLLVAAFGIAFWIMFVMVEFLYLVYALIREGLGREEKPKAKKEYSLKQTREVK